MATSGADAVAPEEAPSSIQVQVVSAASGNPIGSWQLLATATARDVKQKVRAESQEKRFIVRLLHKEKHLMEQPVAELRDTDDFVALGCILEKVEVGHEVCVKGQLSLDADVPLCFRSAVQIGDYGIIYAFDSCDNAYVSFTGRRSLRVSNQDFDQLSAASKTFEVGDRIVARESFSTWSTPNRTIEKGQFGTIVGVDSGGNAKVDFYHLCANLVWIYHLDRAAVDIDIAGLIVGDVVVTHSLNNKSFNDLRCTVVGFTGRRVIVKLPESKPSSTEARLNTINVKPTNLQRP